MVFTFFMSFLLTVAKSAIWICFGIFIYKHYDLFWFIITNKLINTKDISIEKTTHIHNIIEWIGIFVIAMGIITILLQLATIGAGTHHIKY